MPKINSRELANRLRELTGLKQEMQSHSIPTRRQSRIAAKITKHTSLSFNAAALRGVPGGHWTRMVLAKETGTQTLSFERDVLLTPQRSQQNCYTTKSAVHTYGA